MSPTFCQGRSRRIYRYYVSAPLQQGRKDDDDIIRRLPAPAFEKLVEEVVGRGLPLAGPPFAHLLEGMVDAAIWSCEVGVMKPDRAIYELAASRLDTAPAELLMVGDSKQADVIGPRAAGLRALHLDRRTGGGDLTALDGLLSWLSGSDAVTSQVK